jgi:hypothetical protein
MIFETPGKATGEGMAWECAIVFHCSLLDFYRLKSPACQRFS